MVSEFSADGALALQPPWPATHVNAADGSVLARVPAGRFRMGSTPEEIARATGDEREGDRFALKQEMPAFEPHVADFYIGVHAVTNDQFVRFLNSARPGPAKFSEWLPATDHIRAADGTGVGFRCDAGFETHPAVHLSWRGALAYCAWAGLRLPTEIEWEKAARGADGRLYPWGDTWDESRLRWYGGDRGEGETTAPVDAYPEGRSPYGCLQMAGNVEEWCADGYRPAVYRRYAAGDLATPAMGYGRVVRGGTCLRRHRLEFRCAMRRGNDESLVNILFLGLRCARDVPSG